MRSLVTLTTDFGARDPYVAAMKGVLLSICPELNVVDLSHEIAPQDVLEGALFMAGALPYFPAGTVHVAVVDPGVGSERKPIAVSVGGQTVVCPDNGLLTLFAREHPIDEVRVIENPRFMRAPLSATFHGRDVFAPAAAKLACGEPLEGAGPELDGIVTLMVPRPRTEGRRIRGEVIHIDRFGNAISNIQRSVVGEAKLVEVRLGRHVLAGLRRSYADVAAGEPLALFGSSGHLEIAVSGGSASAQLGIGRGDPLEVVIDG